MTTEGKFIVLIGLEAEIGGTGMVGAEIEVTAGIAVGLSPHPENPISVFFATRKDTQRNTALS